MRAWHLQMPGYKEVTNVVNDGEIRTMGVGGLEEVVAVLLLLQAGVTLQICVVVHDERGLDSDG